MSTENNQKASMEPEQRIPYSSKKELPWFVCAAITTCLVMICYAYSEAQNTSKSKKNPDSNQDDSLEDADAINDSIDKSPEEDTEYVGRCIFNVITIIICLLAIMVTWNTKGSEQVEKNKSQ